MSRRLAFGQIRVRRMPGFREAGFAVDDLCPGINLIHGPNASGKSTTAKALFSLLWSDTAPPHAWVEGVFDLHDSSWSVALEGGSLRYRRQGVESPGPELPASASKDRYHLALHELLAADNGDLAQEILRESVGGYDLAQAAQELNFVTRAVRATQCQEELTRARKNLKDAHDRQNQLRQQQVELEDLQKRKQLALDAQGRSQELARAVEYVQAREELAQARQKLEAIPSGVGKLSGKELATLEEITRTLQEQSLEASVQESAMQSQAKVRDDCGLPAGGLEAAVEAALRQRVEDLRECERRRQELHAQLQGLAQAQEQALQTIGPGLEPERLVHVDASAVREMSEFSRKAEQARAKRAAMAELQQWVGSAPGPTQNEQDQLQQALALLQRYLRLPTPRTPARDWRWLVLAVAAMAVAAGLTLTFIHHPLWLALVLAAAGSGVWPWLARPSTPTDPRPDLQREYEALGVAPLSDWSVSAVEPVAKALQDRLATLRVDDEKAKRWAGLAPQIKHAQELADDLEQQRLELVARFGVAPHTDESTLHLLISRIVQWHDANAKSMAVQEQIRAFEHSALETLEIINAELIRAGSQPARDSAQAQGRVESLALRQKRYAQAVADGELAGQRLADAQRQLKVAQARYDSLWQEIGLAPDQESTLREWSGRRDAYKKAHEGVSTAQANVERLTRQLRDPDTWLSQPAGEIETRRQACAQEMSQLEAINQRIGAIDSDVMRAQAGHDLELALATMDEAREALRQTRQENVETGVGAVLVDYLSRQGRDQSRPEVFHRARKLLTLITRGRYRLEFEEAETPRFRAVDTITGLSHLLDELSSGTRVQLLLAVRVAFVEEQERRPGAAVLPLVMDESLANSDDFRASAIIEAVIEVARQGRQVFYFTAQPDEVSKWQTLLASTPDVPYRSYNLADLRRLEEAGQTRLPRDNWAPLAQAPDPGQLSYEQYGQELMVEPFDPSLGIEATHLWHLFEQTASLYRPLKLGISRWGALATLLEQGARQYLGDADEARKVKAAALVLEIAAEAWRIGRGRRVDRTALEDSEQVSTTFMERVSVLATQCHGDAAALLDALERGEVLRFLRRNIEGLRSFFDAQGYLDLSQRLTLEDIRLRLLAQMQDAIHAGTVDVARMDRLLAKLPMA